MFDLSAIATQPLTAALTNIFLALFTVLLTTIIRAAVGLLNANTTIGQRHAISTIANLAVLTAEQLAIANDINPTAKKQYAEGIVIHELDRIGLSLTPTQIDTAIESAVYDAFNYGKQAPSATVTVSGIASPTQS